MKRLLYGLITLVVGASVLVVAEPSAQAIWTRQTMSEVRSQIVGMHVGPSKYTNWGKATITDTYWQDGYVWATYRVVDRRDLCSSCLAGPAGSVKSVTWSVKLGSFATADGSQRRASGGDWWNPFSWDWAGIFGDIWDAWQRCYSGAVKALTVIATTGLVVKGYLSGMSVLSKAGPEAFASVIVGACIASVMG